MTKIITAFLSGVIVTAALTMPTVLKSTYTNTSSPTQKDVLNVVPDEFAQENLRYDTRNDRFNSQEDGWYDSDKNKIVQYPKPYPCPSIENTENTQSIPFAKYSITETINTKGFQFIKKSPCASTETIKTTEEALRSGIPNEATSEYTNP
jgi:hypothetical protein